MSSANSFNMKNFESSTLSLKGLSAIITQIKERNKSYANLIKNTDEFLNYNFDKSNTKEEKKRKKSNVIKYIQILKELYKYNLHYENLLKKYGEKYEENLKSLKNNHMKDINKRNKYLNSEKFFKKYLK